MNKKVTKNVEISILMLTYNHGKFVKKALDGIMMQKIDVPYEVIILDDGSADHTSQILKEYKKRYPELISLYLKKVNSGCPTKNAYFLLSKAKGKYYAMIEGDDYWIDDLKIKKQYEFLTQHREYSACMSDFIVVDEENNKTEYKFYEKKEDHVYTLEDLRHLRALGMTVTFFARNYFDKNEYSVLYKADRMMGDITLYMLCLLKGSIYQLDEAMAAYRYVSKAGKENFNSIQQKNIYRDYMQARYWIKLENYVQQYDEEFRFVPMPGVIKRIAGQYPINVVFRLLMLARNKWRYISLYFVYKFLLESDFLSERKENRYCRKYNWNAFISMKKPIVLFGAGAVAEEYLDKYGWKENIKFLVDNDEEKQNRSLKGFLIKNPNEILNFIDQVAVLITNRNYEYEIEQQLSQLGVKTYFCYCTMQAYRLRNMISSRILQKVI